MKIKKIAQPINKGLLYNEYSNSNEDGYSCSYINNLTEKNILTLTIETENTQLTSTSNYQRIPIPLNTQIYKRGTKLSKTEDGKILIGNGITDIKISASIVCSGSNTQWGLTIFKNNVEQAMLIDTPPNTNFTTLSLSSVPIPVNEGDIIEMRLYIDTSGTTKRLRKYSNNATRLTVEAI